MFFAQSPLVFFRNRILVQSTTDGPFFPFFAWCRTERRRAGTAAARRSKRLPAIRSFTDQGFRTSAAFPRAPAASLPFAPSRLAASPRP